MNSNPSTPEIQPNQPSRPRMGFWHRLGGGSLTISLLVHGAIIALGIILVVQVIPPEPEKQVDFKPGGGGGSSPAAKSLSRKQNSTVKNSAMRVVAAGTTSNFSLPEPVSTSGMSALGSLGGAGMGGLGSGGGGGGSGGGFGQGLGPASGPGIGAGGNPFGFLDPNRGALVGAFYDLKQTSDRKPTGMTPDEHRSFLREFTAGGWKERDLEKYYKAPRMLYQTKIYIPLMDAKAAPAAFQCEKEVEPSRWVVVYRGVVTPSKSGRYRFVGGADDVLVVRLRNKHVFDHGWSLGTIGIGHGGAASVLNGGSNDRDLERMVKKNYPMDVPLNFYQYGTTRNYNRAIKGLAVGPVFTVKAGEPCPIEILVSEIPGGQFCASLLIEEMGVKYEKDPLEGAPILPLFRLDGGQPKVPDNADVPPYDPKGPIWKLVGTGRPQI